MNRKPVAVVDGDNTELQAFLAERIYEYNAEATGYCDGEYFSSAMRDESGAIRAGICGHTWGGCCYVSSLWVHRSERGRGLGTDLLRAAEKHAAAKRCKVVIVATHSFQAPAFYERLGYRQQAMVPDHPVGHASAVFSKRLED